MDPFDYIRPMFIFLRFGWEGLIAAVISALFALCSVYIALWRRPGGDILIKGLARSQFLLCLFWLNNSILYSYCCFSYTTANGANAMTAIWLHDMSYSIVGATFLMLLLAISLLAGLLSYRMRITLSILDVIGLTAAGVSVVVNLIIRNAICVVY
jgi:hypothetical protein